MSRSAKITSTEAVRAFRRVLDKYDFELRDTMTQLELEVRRAVDWIEHDRARYWPRAMREASDALLEAKNNLERAEMALRAEDKRSCYEERAAVEKAKRRLRMAEQKVRAIRKWRVVIKHEVDEFQGQLAKLTNYLETEFPRGCASLDRMAAALDKYTETSAPKAAGGTSSTPDQSPADAQDPVGAEDEET
jgi:hypothetical protein